MVTGASQADAAVFVVDASEGIREQTRRHACLLGMLGIEQVIVLVNKMDRVGWDRERFESIVAELDRFFGELRISPVAAVPASARQGDNVAREGQAAPRANSRSG